ncbi:MAG: hypothetical protein JW936_06150 [Sedimentisphaerales bacterium]|nr:hypothetical protein [Sedimentisphaerales bacterium]
MPKSQLTPNIIADHLARLEDLIDLDHIQRTQTLQQKAFTFQPVPHIPTTIQYPIDKDEWPQYSFTEIFDDPGKMLLQELRSVYAGAKLQDDRLYGIRCNYGTGIIASMFGCQTKVFDNSLPIGLHISPEQLDKQIDQGPPEFNQGLFPKVLETAAFFKETLKPFPKLSQAAGIQVFDTQGTFDNASIIWGSDIYLALFDNPEKFHQLMAIITENILATVKKLRQVTNQPLDEHHGTLNFLGGLCLRNDSCVNLSGEQYLEFVKPYDVQCLSEIGGWIHFCGNANQWYKHLLDIPNLKAINPYQGEFYNLPQMFQICQKAQIPIVQWIAPVDPQARQLIQTGFARTVCYDSYQQAQAALDRLQTKGHPDA